MESRADHHLKVSKTTRTAGRGRNAGEIISSRVESLGPEERQEEVARMLGGKRITDTTRAHAQEMIEASRRQCAQDAKQVEEAMARASAAQADLDQFMSDSFAKLRSAAAETFWSSGKLNGLG